MSTRLPGRDYARVFEQGRSFRTPLFVAWVLNFEQGCAQTGVVVSKKSFHDAVDRNRAKRLLREAFRLIAPRLKSAHWILVGRRALAGQSMQDVFHTLDEFAHRRGFIQ